MIESVVRKKDTYRPAFCPPQFYHDHQSQFKIIQNEISDLNTIEQFAVWVITCSCLRRPKTWYAGLRNQLTPQASPFSIYELFKKISIRWPAQLPQNISLENFCARVNIASLPLSAMNALYHFYSKNYPLEILCYEPDPLELLQIQIQGKRIITFEHDFQKWPYLIYGEPGPTARDPLSFWLHDLIHAEHFFSHPENRRGQIGFYKFISEIIYYKILEPLLLSSEQNSTFQNDFHYLISDMNSHPVHLIKTLNAHITIHGKAISKGNDIWERVISAPIISANDKENLIRDTLRRVNTDSFTTEDALTLTAFLEQDLYKLTLS